MKNGLINENGKLIYYRDDQPVHAGVIEDNGSIYYIGKGGIAVTGRHIVHHEMSNGLLKRGTYTFGEDGKLIEGSYIPPEKKKRKRKKISLKRRIRRWFRRKVHKRFFVFTLALAILLLCTAIVLDRTGIFGDPDQNVGQSGEGEIELPSFASDVYLCSKGAQGLYDGTLTVSEAARYGSPYVPFVFEYNLKGSDGILTLSEHEDMSASAEIFMSKEKTSLLIDNLKTNTKYFYTVSVNGKTYEGSFRTAPSTRFIDIDGIYNTRDIGGYVNMDGKTVRQGLIIRGTELDGLVETGYRLTAAGKEAMKAFGFVYDMDLRAESIFMGEYTSPLGAEVSHEFYTAPQYGHILSAAYKESLRRIFADLANPANYPMYLHCTYGQDRTGTVVFLLQGVLNMSEEQMIREYRMTGFHNPSFSESDTMDAVIDLLQNWEGDTLQEKIVSFLVNDIGVTQEEIESIRSILLQE